MARRHGRTSIWLAALVVVAALAGSASAAPAGAPGPETRLQRALDDLVAAGAPGAVVVVRHGERTVRLTSGYGNLETRTPIRTSDRFRVGSVTKTFVATVILQLVGEGKLSLEDTVERWLPGLIPNGGAITIHQLLNHTAGLFDVLNDGDQTALEPYLNGDFDYVWDPRELVEIAVAHEAHFAPGQGYHYCNTCYLVLGLIVEAATGGSLEAELRERIFDPLGLRGTSFDIQAQIAGRYAHGYDLLGDPPVLTDLSYLSPSYGGAAGAIVSTARDVNRFYRALLRGRLLSPDLLRAMQTTIETESPDLRYGFGLGKLQLPCSAVWGHDGGIIGYGTVAFSSKDGKRQVVLFVNRSATSLSTRAHQAFEHVLVTAYCSSVNR